MSTKGHSSITDSVRAEMTRQGLTQLQLAERMKVGQWWVSRRLNSDISASALLRFAEALDVPVTTFLPEPASSGRRRRRAA